MLQVLNSIFTWICIEYVLWARTWQYCLSFHRAFYRVSFAIFHVINVLWILIKNDQHVQNVYTQLKHLIVL